MPIERTSSTHRLEQGAVFHVAPGTLPSNDRRSATAGCSRCRRRSSTTSSGSTIGTVAPAPASRSRQEAVMKAACRPSIVAIVLPLVGFVTRGEPALSRGGARFDAHSGGDPNADRHHQRQPRGLRSQGHVTTRPFVGRRHRSAASTAAAPMPRRASGSTSGSADDRPRRGREEELLASRYEQQMNLVGLHRGADRVLDREIPGLWRDFYAWDDPAYRDGVIKVQAGRGAGPRSERLEEQLEIEQAQPSRRSRTTPARTVPSRDGSGASTGRPRPRSPHRSRVAVHSQERTRCVG